MLPALHRGWVELESESEFEIECKSESESEFEFEFELDWEKCWFECKMHGKLKVFFFKFSFKNVTLQTKKNYYNHEILKKGC